MIVFDCFVEIIFIVLILSTYYFFTKTFKVNYTAYDVFKP